MHAMESVLEILSDHGVEAVEVDESGVIAVEVPCRENDDRDCAELLGEIETWLAAEGLPFVPEEVDGRIVIRPPAG